MWFHTYDCRLREREPLRAAESWIYGFMISSAEAPFSHNHPGHRQAVFAHVLGLPRWLRQRFFIVVLAMRLGHPDSSLHSSAVKTKCILFIFLISRWRYAHFQLKAVSPLR